jgi:hypothetical protein
VEENSQKSDQTETKPGAETNTSATLKKEAPEFDWVTQRSQCSLPKVFKTLRQQVEADVKTRNALRPQNSPYEFTVTENGTDFSVLLTLKDVRTSVVFSLAEHAIVIRDDKGNLKFEVTLAFDDQGECKLYVNEEEHEPWQIRRMALEELMFKGH